MGVVVDTSCLIALERRLGARQIIRSDLPVEGVLSSIVAAELLLGAELADERHRVARLAFLAVVASGFPLAPFDLAAARRYASIVATLRRSGTPIGDRDAMIAATALAHGHSVLTLNRGEFERVPGLQVLSPP